MRQANAGTSAIPTGRASTATAPTAEPHHQRPCHVSANAPSEASRKRLSEYGIENTNASGQKAMNSVVRRAMVTS